MSNKTRKKDKGWRGSASVWLDAAYTLLVEQGIDSVKVMPLAKHLGLSRTSFYWHFEDREALLAALIERWRQQNTGNLISQTERPARSITEALFHIFDCWVDAALFDARLDFAIRNWAQQSPELKATVDTDDEQRIKAICDVFLRFGYSELEADARARTVYYTQIGYISISVTEPLGTRAQRMPAYIQCFSGHWPSTAETCEFAERHGLLGLGATCGA